MGSFLDTLLGLGSATNTQAAVGQGIGDIWQGVTGANQVLSNTSRNAADAIKTGAANATGALQTGFGQARDDLLDYTGRATGALQTGVDKATSTVLGGNAGYQPFLSSGQGASTMLSNALGLGGQAGHDAATGAFQTSPGYEFQRDQATDAAARKAAALGMSGSGNTLTALSEIGSSLANKEYGSWLDRLSGLSGQGLTAASGISSNNQAAGGFEYGGGGALASLFQDTGKGLSNLGTGLGTALGSIQTGLGTSLGGLQQSLGQQKASNILGGATNTASLGMQGAQVADTAANTNNSILSKLIGGVVGLPMGSGLTTGGGGLSLTPGQNGSFTIAPQASTSGGGILGAMGIKL